MSNTLEIITEAAHDVYGTIGLGCGECVYRNALAVNLRSRGVSVEVERTLEVVYHGQHVGTLRADLVLDKRFVIELKVVAKITDTHLNQCRAYVSRLDGEGPFGGAVLNFGPAGVETRACE